MAKDLFRPGDPADLVPPIALPSIPDRGAAGIGLRPASARADRPSMDDLLAQFPVAEPPAPAAAPKERTWGQAATDLGKELAGGAVGAFGSILRGAGDLPGRDWLKDAGAGSPLFRIGQALGLLPKNPGLESNLLEKPAAAVEGAGKAIEQSVSPQGQQLKQQSTPAGDLFDPSTWSLGSDPSLAGYGQLAANTFGQFLPQLVTLVFPAVGAGMSAAQSQGGAAKEARDLMAAKPVEELRAGSPRFRALEQQLGDPEAAKARLVREAEVAAGELTAPVGALGGLATGKLLGKAGGDAAAGLVGNVPGVAGRVARGGVLGGLSATEEGLQEVGEGVATRTGINRSTGLNLPVTEDSFGNFVQGALGGAPGGAARGLMTPARGADPAPADGAPVPPAGGPLVPVAPGQTDVRFVGRDPARPDVMYTGPTDGLGTDSGGPALVRPSDWEVVDDRQGPGGQPQLPGGPAPRLAGPDGAPPALGRPESVGPGFVADEQGNVRPTTPDSRMADQSRAGDMRRPEAWLEGAVGRMEAQDAAERARLGLTPDVERAQATRTEPWSEQLRPGDTLFDGRRPFMFRSSAVSMAKKIGGEVVPVPGGYVVRQAEVDDFQRRLNTPEIADELRAMANEAGWAQVGGRMTRHGTDANGLETIGRTTWIPGAEWWAGRQNRLPRDANGAKTKAAVEKAFAGEKLSAAERRVVDEMLRIAERELEIRSGARDEFGMRPDDYMDVPDAPAATAADDPYAAAERDAIIAEAEMALEDLADDALDRVIEAALTEGDLTDAEIDVALPDAPAGVAPDAAAAGPQPAGSGGAQGAQRPGPDEGGAGRGEPQGSDRTGAEAFALKGQTPEEVKQQEAQRRAAEEADRKRAAAPPADEFRLTGSDRQADVAAAAGQQDLLADDTAQRREEQRQRQEAAKQRRTERFEQRKAELVADQPWRGGPYEDRIQSMIDKLDAAGPEAKDMRDVLVLGMNNDARLGRLTEESVAFREGKARQELARVAKAGTVEPAEWTTATPETIAAEDAGSGKLPRPILEAAAKKLNEIGPKLAALGYKNQYEVDGRAPREAQDLARQLRDVMNALMSLAPARFRVAKGYKNANPEKLARWEREASDLLGIDTTAHPGVDMSEQIFLGGVRKKVETTPAPATDAEQRIAEHYQAIGEGIDRFNERLNQAKADGRTATVLGGGKKPAEPAGDLFGDTEPRALERPKKVKAPGPNARPLYAARKVLPESAKKLVEWAHRNGFKSTLKPEDLHVTIAYSRDPVDPAQVEADENGKVLRVEGGWRRVEPLGDKGAIVLKFGNGALERRWQQYRDAGASWDWPAYTAHITITYDGSGVDLSKVKRFVGPIELGPEYTTDLDPDAADKVEEQPAPSLTKRAEKAVTEPDMAAEQRAAEAKQRAREWERRVVKTLSEEDSAKGKKAVTPPAGNAASTEGERDGQEGQGQGRRQALLKGAEGALKKKAAPRQPKAEKPAKPADDGWPFATRPKPVDPPKRSQRDGIRRNLRGNLFGSRRVTNPSRAQDDALYDLRTALDRAARDAGIDPSVLDGLAAATVPYRARPVARALRQVFGVEIHFIDGVGSLPPQLIFNGIYVGGRRVFIASDSERPYHQVIGHEFLHWLKRSNPDLFADFARRVAPLLKARATAEMAGARSSEYDGFGYDDAAVREWGWEEVYADVFGDAWAQPAFWREFLGALKPKLANTIVGKWRLFWTRVRLALTSVGVALENADPVVGQLLKDAAAVRATIAEVMAEQAVANRPASEGGTPVRAPGDNPSPWYSELARQIGGIAAKAQPASGWKAAIKGLVNAGRVKADEVEWSGVEDWLDLQQGKVAKEDLRAFVESEGVQLGEKLTGGGKVVGKSKPVEPEVRLREMRPTAMAKLEQLGVTLGFEQTDYSAPLIWFNVPGDVTADGSGGALTGGEAGVYDVDEAMIDVESAWEAIRDDYIEDEDGDGPDGTRYSGWKIPGGTDYGELLITLPRRVQRVSEAERERILAGRKKVFDEYQPRIDALYKAADAYTRMNAPEQRANVLEQMDELIDARDRVAAEQYGEVPEPTVEPAKFHGPHWDEPNVLAHVRFDTRTDADGRRVLFVNEIQSDWAQRGRETGFDGPPKGPAGWVSLNDPKSDGSTASGPFVTATDKWVALAIKRIIRHAAETGHDRVAFATGEQISDALNMTRVVKKIVYEPRGNGTYKVTFYGDGMEWRGSETADDARLEQLLGREIADRIRKGEGEPEKGYAPDGWFIADSFGWHETREAAEAERQQMIANPTYGYKADGTREWEGDRDVARSRLVVRPKDGGWIVQEDTLGHDQLTKPPTALTGVNLTTGGEGNRSFYDRIIPKVANDVLRRLGGGRVGSVALDGMPGRVNDPANPDYKPAVQVGFDVTPALRQRAMQGLPMFNRREAPRRSARTPPAKQAQAERDRMGRLGQLGPMRASVKAWFDRYTKVLGGLPDREFYLEQRYLAQGRIGEADKIAAGIRKAFADASPKDKGQLYEYLTTASGTPDMIDNASLRKAAADTKFNINLVGDMMERAGLFGRDAVEDARQGALFPKEKKERRRFKDAYLPRLYLAHLLDDNDWRAIGAGKKPSDMGYLKKRQDIPEDVRRVILGEIKDPAYLSSMAIVRPMRDIALLGFLEKIAGREGLVLPKSVVEFDGKKVTPMWLKAEADRLRNQARYMEDRGDAKKAVALAERMDAVADPLMAELRAGDYRDWKKLPDSPRYGRLRGLHVRSEVYEDIVGVYDLMPEDLKWYEPQSIVGYGGVGTRVTQWWKVGKVTLNPGSQVRNVVSNLVMLQLSGVSLHMVVPRVIQAIKEIADDGPHWKIAQKFGVTEASFVSRELPEIKRDAIKLQLETMGEHPIKRIGLLATLIGAHVVEKASDVHQAMEYIGKTAKIIDAMAKGATEAEAALEAQDWLFDYSLVPRAVRYLRNQPVAGSPFLTWMYKAAPRLLEVAALHPQRLIPWFGLVMSMPILASMALGGDADDWDEMKRLLPEWARKKSHLQALPFRDSAGRIQFIDLGPYLPWTMWTDFFYNAPSEPVSAVKDLLGSIFSWGPVGSLGVALSTGVDPFTDREIVPKGEPPARQAAAWASYIWSLAMPPLITWQGFLGKMEQGVSGNTNRYGDPRTTMGQAAATLFGANVYGINPDTNAAQEISKLNKDMTDAKIRMLQRLQDRGLSDEKRQSIMAEYIAEINARAQRLQDYAERASKVPKELKVQPEPAAP